MHALSPRVVTEFCKLCGWASDVWRSHVHLFDENPRLQELLQSRAGPALRRLAIVSHEYALLQIVKLHDKAVVAGQATLSIDYILSYGAWPQPVLSRLKDLAAKLDDFAAGLRAARNKIVSHNDLAATLSQAPLGAFAKGVDLEYFKVLQDFVDVVYGEVIGGPYPFGHYVPTDVGELLSCIRVVE